MNKQPPIGAGLEEWVAWVDIALPFRAEHFDGPRDLGLITRIRDRKIAAVAAEQYYRRQAKDNIGRQMPSEPIQQAFDGESWER